MIFLNYLSNIKGCCWQQWVKSYYIVTGNSSIDKPITVGRICSKNWPRICLFTILAFYKSNRRVVVWSEIWCKWSFFWWQVYFDSLNCRSVRASCSARLPWIDTAFGSHCHSQCLPSFSQNNEAYIPERPLTCDCHIYYFNKHPFPNGWCSMFIFANSAYSDNYKKLVCWKENLIYAYFNRSTHKL